MPVSCLLLVYRLGLQRSLRLTCNPPDIHVYKNTLTPYLITHIHGRHGLMDRTDSLHDV